MEEEEEEIQMEPQELLIVVVVGSREPIMVQMELVEMVVVV